VYPSATGAATCAVAVTFDWLLATDDCTYAEALALLLTWPFVVEVLDPLDFVLASESVGSERAALLILATRTFCAG
jgi:hypothetical protein